MTHRRRIYWKILVLVSAVGLSFPVVADAGSGGRGRSSHSSGKSGHSSGRSGHSRSGGSRRTTSRSRGASRHRTSSRRSISRGSHKSTSRGHASNRASNRGHASNRASSARISRQSVGRSSHSRKSSSHQTSQTQHGFRRPTTNVRAPSSSNAGHRRQITPHRVIRNTSGGVAGHTSFPTTSSRNSVGSHGGRSTAHAPGGGSSSVVFSDTGRSRSNFNHSGQGFSSRNGGHGQGTSGAGFVAINGQGHSRSERNVVGQRGGRKFNSGHGAVGAPFAGSLFVNNNVSRYGRAYDRSNVFHDGQSIRSARLYPSGSGGHSSGFVGGNRHGGGYGGYGNSHGGYRNGSHGDNGYYFGSYYYGRRHSRGYYGNYGSVYYPAYSYLDYGYSSYPYYYPYTSVGVSSQTYYDVDPGVAQGYQDVVAEPSPVVTIYVQPAQSGGGEAAPGASLGSPIDAATQAAPQVGQIRIPQSVADGHQAFAQHDVVKARRAYLTAVLADGDDGYAKLFYAMASMAAGEYDVAALALRGALQTASELVTDPIDLRQFYNNDEQIQADMGALVAYISLNADDVDSQLLLAYFQYSMGQADAAQRVLMSVSSDVIEKDATMKELRDAVGVVVSRKQDQP